MRRPSAQVHRREMDEQREHVSDLEARLERMTFEFSAMKGEPTCMSSSIVDEPLV